MCFLKRTGLIVANALDAKESFTSENAMNHDGPEQMVQMTLVVPKEINDGIEEIMRRTRASKSDVICHGLKFFIDIAKEELGSGEDLPGG